jgi:hypothetical protein
VSCHGRRDALSLATVLFSIKIKFITLFGVYGFDSVQINASFLGRGLDLFGCSEHDWLRDIFVLEPSRSLNYSLISAFGQNYR